MTKPRDSNAVHCLNLVRVNDLDRYLSTLLAGTNRQRGLFALYAFDVEISNIAGQVSEPAIGEIRLQWWRDTIDDIYGDACDHHPIAKELQSAVKQYDLPKHLFTNLIDAHQFDLYSDPMASLDDLLAYQTATSVAITELAAQVLFGENTAKIAFPIEKAGMAQGLTKLLNSIPLQISRHQCFIPANMLAKHDLDSTHLLAREYSNGMRQIFEQLTQIIVEQLKQLRHEQSTLKKEVLPAFFPASLAGLTLKSLIADDNHNPLKQPVTVSQLKMQWHLMKCSLFKRI